MFSTVSRLSDHHAALYLIALYYNIHLVLRLTQCCKYQMHFLNCGIYQTEDEFIVMTTFGEYRPSVVTRDSPCWIPGTAPII